MKFRVLTLFPEMFDSFLNTSIIGRAISGGQVEVTLDNIRDYTENKHGRVDDTPFGGGAGMVMCVQPLKDALMAKTVAPGGRVIYLSPKGETLTHAKVVELAKLPEIVLVCGHYEGIDQRFIDRYVDEELSIGDYVLTGGETAAMVVIDSVSRMVADVLSNEASAHEDSFSNDLLEYPHYTRPAVYDGDAVPDVLLSGNHAEIDRWRLIESLKITKARRPELFTAYMKKVNDLVKDKKTLQRIKKDL